MKKLFAYITICVSCLIGAVVGIVPSIVNINGNIEYSRSRQYVFKIGDRITDSSYGDETVSNEYDLLSDSDKEEELEDIVDIFKTRLNNAQVNEYSLVTDGYDTIKVTFKTDSELYDDVESYLTFSWSLMASTYGSETNVTLGYDAGTIYTNLTSNIDNDYTFFEPGSAYIEYKNNYPYVVIGLSDPESFKSLYKTAAGLNEDSTTSGRIRFNADGAEVDDSSDEEDTETSNENKIFILNDWLDGFKLEDLIEDSSSSSNMLSSKLKEHVLFTIDATSPENVYWDYDEDDDQDEVTYEEIYFGGYGLISDDSYYGNTIADEGIAYKKANIWMQKFNSESYKYQITCVNSYGEYSYSSGINPSVEYLNYNNKVTISSLLIATGVAILFAAIVMAFKFGLPSFASIVFSLATFVSSLACFNLLGVEFNIGTILGILTISIVSLVCGGILFKKVKNEIYLGYSYKKAFSNGNKKAFWYMLDFSIFTLIAGVVSYLIPSNIMLSFGSVLVIGTLFNILFNIIGVRITAWLLYSSSIVEKNPRLLLVEKKYVPDLSNDEKPSYTKNFEYKTSKKKRNIFTIVLTSLALVSTIGIVVFQAINGSIYNNSTSSIGTEVYVEKYEENDESIDNTIDNYVLELETSFENNIAKDASGETKLFSSVEVENYYYLYKEGDVESRKYYYVIEVDSSINYDDTFYYSLDNGVTWQEDTFENLTNSICEIVFGSYSKLEILNEYEIDDESNNLYILIYGSIVIGVITLYFVFRFGPSKALTSFAITLCSTLLTVGIFVLTRVPVTSIITLSLLFTIVITYLIFDIFFNFEKENYSENKNEYKTNFDLKVENFEYLQNEAFDFVLTILSLSIFSFVGLVFASGIDNYIILMSVLGLFISAFSIKLSTLNIEIFLNRRFSKIGDRINFKPKRISNRSKTVENDEGPEEAIFIGIND